MKITKIEQQKKNNKRYSVFLDGEFAFGIHEEILFKSGLHSGDTLEQSKVEELQSRDSYFAAKEAAFHLLKYRQRSIAEMRFRLKQKSYAPDAIDDVIADLIEHDYLNDLEFARTFAEDQLSRKKIGPFRLKSELKKKRVPEKIIAQVASDVYKKYDVIELAQSAADKKMRSLRKTDPETAYRRLVSYLQRRGFSWDVINMVVHPEE